MRCATKTKLCYSKSISSRCWFFRTTFARGDWALTPTRPPGAKGTISSRYRRRILSPFAPICSSSVPTGLPASSNRPLPWLNDTKESQGWKKNPAPTTYCKKCAFYILLKQRKRHLLATLAFKKNKLKRSRKVSKWGGGGRWKMPVEAR